MKTPDTHYALGKSAKHQTISPMSEDLCVLHFEEFKKPLTYKMFNELAVKCECTDETNIEDQCWESLKDAKTKRIYCIEDGSCFAANAQKWNLFRFTSDDSIIHAIPTRDWMPGIQTPCTYVGMLGTAFGWHREDRNLLSINFLHEGKPELWYGVPAKYADKMETLIQSEVEKLDKSTRSDLGLGCSLAIRHKAIHVPPSFLKKHQIPFGKVRKFDQFIHVGLSIVNRRPKKQ